MSVRLDTRRAPFRRALSLLGLALLVLTCVFSMPTARAQRVALVVGNASYTGAVLPHAVADARLMQATLLDMDFQVTALTDADRGGLLEALRVFVEQARGANIAVLYFAGRGGRVEGGDFILPVDALVRSEAELRGQGIDASEVLRLLEEARPAQILALLDACRVEPYAGAAGSGTRGLGRVATATPVVLARAPCNVAAADPGPQSIYATALVRHLLTPGLELSEVFGRAAAEVERVSSGLQRPEVNLGEGGSFVLWQGRAGAVAGPGRSSAPGEVFQDCSECPQMVILPAGRFMMGSSQSEVGREADEGPRREVVVGAGLAIGRHEVTLREFGLFVASTGYRTEAERDVAAPGCVSWQGPGFSWVSGRHWREPGFPQGQDHPVVCVSWNDAQAYLAWLNQKVPAAGYRLPNEAEWEYAARAGSSVGRFPWGDDLSERELCAWANGADQALRAQAEGAGKRAAGCSDGHARTAPGDALRPNAFGLHHMLGNVWEWTQDAWRGDTAGPTASGEAGGAGADTPASRALRGGSWINPPVSLRAANRHQAPAGTRSVITGFRVVRSLPAAR